jgi:undecaprenyl-diphosphatase
VFVTSIAVPFFINSLILFSTRKISQNTSKISFKQAFFIGVSQILTAFSGISRLGVTFAVVQAQGLSSESAFNFSLALFVPISFGALIFDSHHLNYSLVFTPYFFIALIFAILINILALKISQKLIISHKFWYFAFYTLILALILFFLP